MPCEIQIDDPNIAVQWPIMDSWESRVSEGCRVYIKDAAAKTHRNCGAFKGMML